MSDEQVLIEFLAQTQGFDEKTRQMQQQVRSIQDAASGKGSGLSFEGIMHKIIPPVAVLLATRTAIMGITAVHAVYAEQQARARNDLEGMLDAQERFRESLARIPIIGERIIRPFQSLYRLLSGSQAHVETLKKAIEMMKTLEADAVSTERTIKFKAELIGLDGFQRQVREIVNATLSGASDKEAEAFKQLSEVRRKLAEEDAKFLQHQDIGKIDELRRANNKLVEDISRMRAARSEQYRVEMSDLATTEQKKQDATDEEKTRQAELIRIKQATLAEARQAMSEEAAQAKADAAVKAKQLDYEEADSAKKTIEHINQIAYAKRAAGETYDEAAALKKAAAAHSTYYDDKRNELDRETKDRLASIAQQDNAAQKAQNDDNQRRKAALRNDIDVETLRAGHRDAAAKILEIENRYSEQLARATDSEERRLLIKKRELETSRALLELEKGRFTVGDITTRARVAVPGAGDRVALSQRREEGLYRVGKTDLERTTGVRGQMQEVDPSSIYRVLRDYIQTGKGEFYSPTGERLTREQVITQMRGLIRDLPADQKYSVGGSPTVTVNGKLVSTLINGDQALQAIDSMLKSASPVNPSVPGVKTKAEEAAESTADNTEKTVNILAKMLEAAGRLL